VRNRRSVSIAMFGCEAVFHLAYVQGTQTFYSKPKDVIDVALKGVMNVLETCETQGRKQLFLVSSSEVYQVPPEGYFPTAEDVPLTVPDVTNPRYSYGGGKIASEVAAFAYADLLDRLVVIRPHNIYGPDMGWEHVIPEFAKRMYELPAPDFLGRVHDFPIQGSGHETRSFCHILDCIKAMEVLLHRGEHRTVYHVGNPEEVTIATLAKKIAARAGHTINIQPSEAPKGSPARRLPDISRLKALGYRPTVDLDMGLPGTLDWYRDHA
jgi:nucleoside-diphosphate-sugar epimerase